jgi:hypothetical protein
MSHSPCVAVARHRTVDFLVSLIGVVLACVFIPAPMSADETAARGWDDSHMRSNHVQQGIGPATRPPIQGASGYGQLASGTAEPVRTTVPETLEGSTQREWKQGPITRSSPKATTERSSTGGMSRGSALRAGAVSRR